MSAELQLAREALRRARMRQEARQYLFGAWMMAKAMRCKEEASRLSRELEGKGKV